MTGMRGDLSDTGLETIFGELAASGSTGALHLEGRPGPGKVFFREGDVYYASSPAPRAQLGARLVGAGFLEDEELDRALAVQDDGPSRTKLGAILVDQEMVQRDVIRVFVQEQILDAVFDLARWDHGTFEFFRGDAVAEDLPVQIPTGPLVMEVSRRLAEWEDISAVIPSLDAVPDFVPGGSTTQAALEPDEFTLLTSVDGRRSVRELAHDLGYSQFDAARLVYGLSLLGVIGVPNGQVDGRPEPTEEPVPEPETGGPEPPADEEADVDVGRALEEALFGGGFDEPPTEEPEEAVARHDHTIEEEPTGDLEEIAREAARSSPGPTEERAPPPGEFSGGSDDLEPEVWSASIDTEDAGGPGTAPETEPDEAPTGPEPAWSVDEPSDEARQELLALVDELQGPPDQDEAQPGTEVEPEPEDEAEPEDQPDATPDRASGFEDLGTVAPPPDAPGPPSDAPEEPAARSSGRTERGDVSELLRELSRLAGGGPEPVAPTPDDADEPEDSADDEPSEPPDEPTETGSGADDRKDDDKRSTFRRLFGSR